MACLLGVISGVLLLMWDLVQSGTTHRSLSFDSAIFFTFMLPPIIFYGGLAIKRRLFVSNLVSICAFGIIGTFVSFTLIGAALVSLSLLPNVLSFDDCFSLAAIFAATDSVAVLQVCLTSSCLHSPRRRSKHLQSALHPIIALSSDFTQTPLTRPLRTSAAGCMHSRPI